MLGRTFNAAVQWLHQLVVGSAAQPAGDGDISASGGLNLGAATGATAGVANIKGVSGTQLILDVASGQQYTQIDLRNNGGAKVQVGWDNTNSLGYLLSAAALIFYANSLDKGRFTSAGALLVGKTAPAGTDAAGNVEINGSLRVGASQVWAAGTALPATTGTVTITMDGTIKTLTPTGAITLNATGGVTGQTMVLYITTSGTSSFVVTFGTNFKTTGTLSTGTVDAKVFIVSFICKDGTTWAEMSRTVAM